VSIDVPTADETPPARAHGPAASRPPLDLGPDSYGGLPLFGAFLVFLRQRAVWFEWISELVLPAPADVAEQTWRS